MHIISEVAEMTNIAFYTQLYEISFYWMVGLHVKQANGTDLKLF